MDVVATDVQFDPALELACENPHCPADERRLQLAGTQQLVDRPAAQTQHGRSLLGTQGKALAIERGEPSHGRGAHTQ